MMTNPKDEQRKHDELELDAETVKDLEPDKGSAEAVRGGVLGNTATKSPETCPVSHLPGC